MRFLFFFLSLFFLSLSGISQVVFDFEKGDLEGWTQAPAGNWAADTVKTITGLYSLHHVFDNSESGTDRISYPLPHIVPDSGDMVFRFRLRHGYAPASSNNWGVFLYADRDAYYMKKDSAINGYVLGVNMTGSDDSLRLWKVRNGKFTGILNAGLNWEKDIGISLAPLMEVKRSPSGVWEVRLDTSTNGNNFTTPRSVRDTTFHDALYMGILYTYSPTKDRLLWIDDIRIQGKTVVDTVPPFIKEWEILPSRSIQLTFSEPVCAGSEVNAAYVHQGEFSVSDSLSASSSGIILDFPEPFPDGDTVYLTLWGASDCAGNTMTLDTVIFLFHAFKQHEVLINEVMADPSPRIGLPEYEYAELFNTTAYNASLDGWTFRSGKTAIALDGFSIGAGGYLVLTYKNAGAAFGEEVATAPVFTSESFLTNTGSQLVLTGPSGMIMDAISYTDDWYGNSLKADGGWSLEMIDSENPCAGRVNWSASEDPSGGTPGLPNSICNSVPDNDPPVPLYAAILNDSTVTVSFNEPPDSGAAVNRNFYSIDHGLGHPLRVAQEQPEGEAFLLYYQHTFMPDCIYELRVDRGISDCTGNTSTNSRSLRFAIPSEPQPFDIVINEIMFNPDINGEEFIEIYNISNRVIDLSGIWLAILGEQDDDIRSRAVLSSSSRLMFPEDYLVLCKNKATMEARYIMPYSWSCLELENMPQLNDDSGRAGLLDRGLQVIDAMEWSADMQFSLLHDPEGVSLEKIHPSGSSGDPGNWHSASSLAGYATPGRQNSQYLGEKEDGQMISVQPEVFTPDNDGVNDVLEIILRMSNPDWMTDVRIYEVSGRLVRRLVSNKMTGTEGRVAWNGTNDDGILCYNGIYVLFIRLYDLEGHIREFRKTCVLYVK